MKDKSTYAPGTEISKGKSIGLIGKTATAAPHLHFEITKGNNILLQVAPNGDIKIPMVGSDALKNGWYWPGPDNVFINDNYYEPSKFIVEHQLPQPGAITVEGNKSDWAAVPVLVVDPSGDGTITPDGVYHPASDILRLSVTNSACEVFFLYEFTAKPDLGRWKQIR